MKTVTKVNKLELRRLAKIALKSSEESFRCEDSNRLCRKAFSAAHELRDFIEDLGLRWEDSRDMSIVDKITKKEREEYDVDNISDILDICADIPAKYSNSKWTW
jgi:hypothetical protein